MKIAILGTGMVGKAHASRLVELGHEAIIGTRNVTRTMANDKPDHSGLTFSEWHNENPSVKVMTFAAAAKQGEIIYNSLLGDVTIDVLTKLEGQIGDKILIDISNPLNFSKGMPPTLFVCNTDSLGEQIQDILPNAKVIKAFNTMNSHVQVNPKLLAGGDHHIIISGNDADAKQRVNELLRSYGWEHIIDLGDITTARGTEMYLPLWLRLWGSVKSPMFNIKIVTNPL